TRGAFRADAVFKKSFREEASIDRASGGTETFDRKNRCGALNYADVQTRGSGATGEGAGPARRFSAGIGLRQVAVLRAIEARRRAALSETVGRGEGAHR